MIIRKYVQIGPTLKTVAIVSYDKGVTWFYDDGEPVDMDQVYEYSELPSYNTAFVLVLIGGLAVLMWWLLS